MSDPFNLKRFLDAQSGSIGAALAELRGGAKESHWMWFVFPQLAALGRSGTAKFYGLGTLAEAEAYLNHPVLGVRLRDCVGSVLPWASRRSAEEIFGAVDSIKLRSSLTLFDRVEPRALFAEALVAFFGGERDALTLALLDGER
jgi:uncharacterized protein (DUF1810 family)